MPAPSPLISLIIVCRNPGARLEAALESIWSQNETPPHEIIVIDGASTDGTADWLAQHSDRIAHWFSAPDDGIYDAMNQGIAAATGEWVYFIGADDELAALDVLYQAGIQLADCPHSVASGTAKFDDGRTYYFAGDHHAIRRNPLHHQATFYRRSLFDQLGLFDTSFRIQADYEFNLRVWHEPEPIFPISLHVANCASGGLSDGGEWQNYREEIAARHLHFPAWQSVFWDAVTLLRYLRKIVVRRTVKKRAE